MTTKKSVPVSEPISWELPDITHLQFLVLAYLAKVEELPGRDLRELLSKSGVKSTGPGFYQLMSRLEDSNHVEGWYAEKELAHQVVKERRYRITESGLAAWKKTSDFYFSHSPSGPHPGSGGRPVTRSPKPREEVSMSR